MQQNLQSKSVTFLSGSQHYISSKLHHRQHLGDLWHSLVTLGRSKALGELHHRDVCAQSAQTCSLNCLIHVAPKPRQMQMPWNLSQTPSLNW